MQGLITTSSNSRPLQHVNRAFLKHWPLHRSITDTTEGWNWNWSLIFIAKDPGSFYGKNSGIACWNGNSRDLMRLDCPGPLFANLINSGCEQSVWHTDTVLSDSSWPGLCCSVTMPCTYLCHGLPSPSPIEYNLYFKICPKFCFISKCTLNFFLLPLNLL